VRLTRGLQSGGAAPGRRRIGHGAAVGEGEVAHLRLHGCAPSPQLLHLRCSSPLAQPLGPDLYHVHHAQLLDSMIVLLVSELCNPPSKLWSQSWRISCSGTSKLINIDLNRPTATIMRLALPSIACMLDGLPFAHAQR
jgi:hypothetical protein